MNTSMSLDRLAPGRPGIDARWTSSAKTGVGTALDNQSRVWFPLRHGICNEIYYQCVDQACVRDMVLIVTYGTTFFSEEQRDAESTLLSLADGVPASGSDGYPRISMPDFATRDCYGRSSA
jgi:glucoamylase